MQNFLRQIKDAPYRLLALATVASVATVAPVDRAHAASSMDLGAVANNLQTQGKSISALLVTVGFLAGIIMCTAGLFKLRAASEDGGQRVKYSEGLWRLGVGAALCGLPLVTDTSIMTVFGTDTTDSAVAAGQFTAFGK